MKDLFKMVVVMNRETFIEYGYASSEKQAKLIAARRVAKKHGVLPVIVNMYFKEHPDCCLIKKEVEFMEVEDGS